MAERLPIRTASDNRTLVSCLHPGDELTWLGVGEGSWEAGMWDYKALPLPGSEEINDHQIGASYSYDRYAVPSFLQVHGAHLWRRNKRLLVSYDTPAIAKQKAHYINQHGLGGGMWWELDADKPEPTGLNLVRTVREQFGQLEWRENELNYPGSSERCR